MTRKNVLPSSRRHIWVFDDDWQYLEKAFGPESASRLGVGPAIRQIVHIYVGNLRQQEQQRIDKQRALPAKAPAANSAKDMGI